MTTENGGFDAGAMYDEGVADAEAKGGLPDPDIPIRDDDDAAKDPSVMEQENEPAPKAEEAEPVKTEKPEGAAQDDDAVKSALKSTEQGEEPEPEPESIIANLLPKAEAPEAKPDQRVPVEDHIKLRQRAQAAERERDELRERLSKTPTGGEKPGEQKVEEEEISPVERYVQENPDEDFVPAKVQADQLQWERQQRRKQADAQAQAERKTTEEAEQQQAQIAAVQQLGQKANESEKAARKANPDYDQVINAALGAGLVNAQDVQALIKTDDIAGNLYKIAKQRLGAIRQGLGLPVPASQTTQTKAPAENQPGAEEESAELTDDEVYDEVKDLFPAG